MFGDLTENESQDVLSSFKHFFKKEDVPLNDLELSHCKSSPSTSGSQQELAVCVRDAHKHYGFGRNSSVVFDGLNMTVPKGTVYALLGASGCGKTTLLSCILGCRKLDSGKTWILGGSPGSRSCGIPGPRVGYMPQETALYIDLTIDETFLFYGWVAGMTTTKIQERGEFLKKLFMLPDAKHFVKTLSGGQQRRVSLASALLHEPEMLILDEPTVGLDPLLRETIWQHFVDLAGVNTTIILTTHYIEEARQAHIVGLMRGGRLLAEEPPKTLIMRYGGTTLEDVFLKLSVQQNKQFRLGAANNGPNSAMQYVNGTKAADKEVCANVPDNRFQKEAFELHAYDALETDSLQEIPPQDKYDSKFLDYLHRIKAYRLQALIWKGLTWAVRNYTCMLLVVLLPITQIPIFCLAVGHDPVNLQVAVVNYETNNTVNCNRTLTCDSMQLSCSYFGYLERRGLNLVNYDSEDEARYSVLSTKSYASMVVKRNYSAALRARMDDWYGPELWDIEASEIDVVRDISDKHIAMQLKVYFYDTFLSFAQDFAESCGIGRKALKLPIRIEKPIYGNKYPSYADYILPGLLAALTFVLSAGQMAFIMIVERREASFDRTLVIGITEIEMLIAQITCQCIPVALQSGTSIICAFFIFSMTQRGSYIVIAVHTLLTAFCGMCFGLLISCICNREATSALMALSSVLPMVLLCGVIWPIEAMYPLMQPVAYILPLTKPINSLRSILQKGWGFSSEIVYMSLVHLGGWALIFLITSIVFLKYKKS